MVNIRDAFYEVLRSYGISTIFGNPGSNELPLLSDLPADFRYIHALQEGAAIGMADGYARATGRPALVNVHAAGGTGNAMGNLTNTQAGHVPVIVTSGQQARRYAALEALLTNVDAPTLAKPLVKWSNEPLRPQDVPYALSKGILLATSAPAGPVYLSLPLDDWDADADADALAQLTVRAIYGNPVVAEASLDLLRDRLTASSNPVMILGPGTDDAAGWDGATRLAESLALPVFVAPSPSRCPFPTRHPNYRGILPSDIPGVASKLEGHDLIAAFGTAIFRYHVFADGDYLPPGAELWSVTSDPDEAARAPVGRALIGNPSDALVRLADTTLAGERPPLTAPARPRPLNEAGPEFSADAIIGALDAATDENTVIAHEWTSVDTTWDRFDLSRPGSLYFPDAGALGWGLPAAIGLQLGHPSRRVLAILGDGALHYTVSALWTAARYRVPVVFVVARNQEYAALKNFAQVMQLEGVPGLELPDIDITGIAEGYGIPATRVVSLSQLTTDVEAALSGDGPHLVEVPQQRATT
ncbi:MAG: benzoylformate decarboxylase [Pseudonocardia sp.]|uniref:benzoylformate decarboxylase n=1 Tax=unclassified Pseudonocardia TaxID=2619320 RepID=UPI000869D928|nr:MULTISPECIES: benzoylformate decarboxylase [unclassified Pseudonocardia]MBN9113576.1 benzoylformate decarboxylase [Pseudonocardia sp.]ODU29625.1 MAG: benzoylformate decarboxylase [Pseudonocardia sp. SCN 72-51]ODV00466.1 MAG: benzoylformate decarboxylase [Pseudonocardia sp. SCN 73-27]